MERDLLEDTGSLDRDEFTGILNNVYSSIETAKKLFDLYLDKERLKVEALKLESAQKGVLI